MPVAFALCYCASHSGPPASKESPWEQGHASKIAEREREMGREREMERSSTRRRETRVTLVDHVDRFSSVIVAGFNSGVSHLTHRSTTVNIIKHDTA